MYRRYHKQVPQPKGKYNKGFTLVELLVVLTIIGVMASLAIPGLRSMGAFARDDLQSGTRDLYVMIRAARNHAVTFRVNTAVVYVLDNYQSPNVNAENTQVLSNDQIDNREIRAVAVFVEAPPEPGSTTSVYVPVDGEWGEFREFQGNMSILLQDPDDPSINYYQSARPRFDLADAAVPDGNSENYSIAVLGMESIQAEVTWVDNNDEIQVGNLLFPAHVFRSSGRLSVSDNRKERYTIHFGPSNTAPLEDRLTNPYPEEDDVIVNRRIANPIQIFRSTGRVQIAN